MKSIFCVTLTTLNFANQAYFATFFEKLQLSLCQHHSLVYSL